MSKENTISVDEGMEEEDELGWYTAVAISRAEQLGNRKKVYGVPKLPQKIDAMYENQCRGNLYAYYLDPDPVRSDPVFEKLGKLVPEYLPIRSGSEIVARHLQYDMEARQMNEKTYNHISRMPLKLLGLEFAVRHKIDKALKKDIETREDYMRSDKQEWIDADK